MNMRSFTDELLKIAQAGWPVELGKTVLRGGRGVADKIGGKGLAIAIPATALGSILAWEKGKQMKRRYDIGKMVEESQAQRG